MVQPSEIRFDRCSPTFVSEDGPECSAQPAVLARGSSVGRYLILGRHGEGGMGVVYLAYDPELDRKVALKVIKHRRRSHGRAEVARARALREAQATAKLSHPNVVSIFDVGLWREGPEAQMFLAMEWLEGVELGQWLTARNRESAPRDPAEILGLFVQAGRGLHAAHQAGIVHRDFKPENVWVGADGRVRVLDFGLAQPATGAGDDIETMAADCGELDEDVAAPSSARLTRPGARVGTPRYMAPEQHRGEPLCARADQFSFCVALYEALWGQYPFAGETPGEMTSQVLSGSVLPPPATKGVPSWVRRAVLRGLSPDPAERFDTMEDLLAELARPMAARARVGVAAGGAALALAATATVGFHFANSGAVAHGNGDRAGADAGADGVAGRHTEPPLAGSNLGQVTIVRADVNEDGVPDPISVGIWPGKLAAHCGVTGQLLWMTDVPKVASDLRVAGSQVELTIAVGNRIVFAVSDGAAERP